MPRTLHFSPSKRPVKVPWMLAELAIAWQSCISNVGDTSILVVGFFVTLQGINISHLGKREIIFKSAIFGGYISSLEGTLPEM